MKRTRAVRLFNNAMTAVVHVNDLVDEQNAERVRKATKAMWRLYKENRKLKATLRDIRLACTAGDKTTDYISAVASIQRLLG